MCVGPVNILVPAPKLEQSLLTSIQRYAALLFPLLIVPMAIGDQYDGGVAVMDAPAELGERGVYVGVRPEGFIPDENGAFTCNLSSVEVMGRDVSIVSTHPCSANPLIRSIVDADNKIDKSSATVKYSLKPHKVLIFNKETEERIYFEV